MIRLRHFFTLVISSAFIFTSFYHHNAQAGSLYEVIKKRGHVICGVNTGLVGFAAFNSKGKMEGLDIDLCHAIAAAVFGDKEKVKFKALSATQRFTALQSGEVDVLTRNTTRTLSRDSSLGLNFGPVNFYDGQRFMVHADLGVTSAKELEGATICIMQGTTTEQNAADYFRAEGIKLTPVVYEDINEVRKAFFSRRCDVYTGDGSELVSAKMESEKPENYSILEEVISKEPLAPAVRHGDDQWYDVVSYAQLAMVNAEELGISSQNVDEMLKSGNPKIKRLLGVIKGNGKALSLPEDFAYQVIKQVGNYGESYDRHIGEPLELARGLNALWKEGGLMYSPPFK